ncbi:hypothetical protein HDU77_007212 [Chytriomyces hyalinus]|nr:hypothetical protein HDU77_007212 [Chytriomyces hyalinus]
MPSLLSLLGLAGLLLNLLSFTLAQSPTGCYSLRTLPDKATKISSMEPFVCMDHCGKDTLALIGPFPHDPFNFYCGCSNFLPSTPASTSCNLVCPGASIPTLKSPCGGYTNGIEAWSGYVYGELPPSPVPSPSPSPVQSPPEIGVVPIPTTAASSEAPVPPPSNDAVATSSVVDTQAPIPGPITSSAASSSSASFTVKSASSAAVSNSSTVLIQSASGSTIPTSTPMAAAVDSGTNSNIAIISACMGALIVLIVLCLGVHCWRRQRQSRFKNNTPHYGYNNRDESEFGDGAALFNAHHSGSRFNSSKRSEDSRQQRGGLQKRPDGHEGDTMSRFLHGYKAGLQQGAQVHRQESADPQVVYVLPYEGSVLVSKKSKTFTAAGPAAGQWEKVPRFMPSNTKLGAMTVVLQPNGDVEDANRYNGTQNEDFKNPQALHKDYRLWSGDVIAPSIRTAATSVFSMEDKFTNSGNGQTHSVADSSIFMHHAAKNAVLDLEGAKLLSKQQQQQQQQQQMGAAVVIEPVQ